MSEVETEKHNIQICQEEIDRIIGNDFNSPYGRREISVSELKELRLILHRMSCATSDLINMLLLNEGK